MKAALRNLFKDFCRDYSSRLCNDTCGDLEMPNTPENRDLLYAAVTHMHRGDSKEELEESLKDYKNKFESENPPKKIVCLDWMIFNYLKSEVLEELAIYEDLKTS